MTPWWLDRRRLGFDDRRAQRMALRRFGVALLRDPVCGAVWRFSDRCVLALARALERRKWEEI